jgi:hypothetical protein
VYCDGIRPFNFPLIVYLSYYRYVCVCVCLCVCVCVCVCNLHKLPSIRRVTQAIVILLFQQAIQSIIKYKFISDFNHIACKRGGYKSARRPTFLSPYWTTHRPLIPVSRKQCGNRQCRPDADVRATNF